MTINKSQSKLHPIEQAVEDWTESKNKGREYLLSELLQAGFETRAALTEREIGLIKRVYDYAYENGNSDAINSLQDIMVVDTKGGIK